MASSEVSLAKSSASLQKSILRLQDPLEHLQACTRAAGKARSLSRNSSQRSSHSQQLHQNPTERGPLPIRLTS